MGSHWERCMNEVVEKTILTTSRLREGLSRLNKAERTTKEEVRARTSTVDFPIVNYAQVRILSTSTTVLALEKCDRTRHRRWKTTTKASPDAVPAT
jgi:hypothetical protein